MKISSIVVLCFIFTALSFSQDKAASTKKPAAISGIVVKEPGSQPLKKATITLVAENQEEGGNYTVTTDPDGHFSLANIRPGRYRMLLERTGYTEINERHHRFDGRTISLSPGQELNDVRLTMLMAATALGKVVDEDGDPIPNVEVTAMRKSYRKTQWESVGSERTNDLGEYRISGLFPGHYYFAASPPPDYQRLAVMEKPEVDNAESPNDQSALRRLTTYYPGTSDRSQAAALDLRAGDEIPVNFAMLPGRAYTVRGTVATPAGKQAAVLLTAREFGLVFNSAEVQKNGRFEVHGVPPGSYVAMALTNDDSGEPCVARQRIDVVASDVEDVRLVPLVSGDVRGQILSESPSAFSQGYVMLRSLDDEGSGSAFELSNEIGRGGGGQVKPDGTFEIKNVGAGKYAIEFVTASPAARDYFVRSVRLGGSPADMGFSVNGSTGPLYITLSSQAASVEGSATDDHDKPLSDCTVVAVPEEPFRKLPVRYGKSRTDQNGRFTIRGLAPGAYSIYAWQDLEGELYMDPDFLKSQESFAKNVQAEAGKKTSISLKAIAIPDDAR